MNEAKRFLEEIKKEELVKLFDDKIIISDKLVLVIPIQSNEEENKYGIQLNDKKDTSISYCIIIKNPVYVDESFISIGLAKIRNSLYTLKFNDIYEFIDIQSELLKGIECLVIKEEDVILYLN